MRTKHDPDLDLAQHHGRDLVGEQCADRAEDGEMKFLTWLKIALCRHPDGFVYWDHLSDECPRCGKLIQMRGR